MWILLGVVLLLILIICVFFLFKESKDKKMYDNAMKLFGEYDRDKCNLIVEKNGKRYNEFYNYIVNILEDNSIKFHEITYGYLKNYLLNNSVYGKTNCITRDKDYIFYIDSLNLSLGFVEVLIMCKIYSNNVAKNIQVKAEAYYEYVKNDITGNINIHNMTERFNCLINCPEVKFKVFNIDDIDYFELKEIDCEKVGEKPCPFKKKKTIRCYSADIHFVDEKINPTINMVVEEQYNILMDIMPEKFREN